MLPATLNQKPLVLREGLSRFSSVENVPAFLIPLLSARGVVCEEDLGQRLTQLAPASQLRGLAAAVALVVEAIQTQQRILIVGDYDADGATSCALMMRVLNAFGAQHLDYLVPNRFEYGYGLSPEIVAVAQHKQPDLIVTVDNGIASVAGVAAARALGIRVLITDHHLPPETLPDADAILNPNQRGCTFPSKSLAGVGVAFYLLCAVATELKQTGWFAAQGLSEPKMSQWLDLVALGTVADVVPLDRNNRILVSVGLRVIRSGAGCPGIRALFSAAGRDFRSAASTDLGFLIGPRVNAAGRLDDISVGIQCLLTDNEQQAHEIASALNQLNRDRQAIEQGMQREADQLVAQLTLAEGAQPAYCLFHSQWHQGVVGLLASRVKEAHYRPVIAFAPGEQGTLKGSGRSIPGYHMRDALDTIATENPGLIEKFGGHAMAAGLSLSSQNLAAFERAFVAHASEVLTRDQLQQNIIVDGVLHADDLTLLNARWIRDGIPWGQQFPEPLFFGRFKVLSSRVLAEKHLRLQLVAEGARSQPFTAIWFRADLQRMVGIDGRFIDVTYRLAVNEFRGDESLQLMLSEVAFSDEQS